jgi:hypothetical protein
MYYRISNSIYTYQGIDSETLRKSLATKFYEEGKSKTQIDIHPGATIGQGFIMTHGMNTVIGDSVIIGSKCCMNHGVILGSRDIINSSTSRDHPVIGNRVEIGGFARIFGPIKYFKYFNFGELLFGIGLNRLVDFSFSHGFFAYNYANAFIYSIISFGIFGAIIWIIFNIYLFIFLSRKYRILYIILFLVSFSDQILFNRNLLYLLIWIFLFIDVSKMHLLKLKGEKNG